MNHIILHRSLNPRALGHEFDNFGKDLHAHYKQNKFTCTFPWCVGDLFISIISIICKMPRSKIFFKDCIDIGHANNFWKEVENVRQDRWQLTGQKVTMMTLDQIG